MTASLQSPLDPQQRAMMFDLLRRTAKVEILPRFRNLEAAQINTKSGPTDLVTEADIAAEAMITHDLQRAFPDALIIGEESVAERPDYRAELAEAELAFIIDPVDGTWNYANGLPLFGTILAATRFGRPVFGAIYDPICDDMVWADIETATLREPLDGPARRLTTRATTELALIEGFAEPHYMPENGRAAAMRAFPALSQVGAMRCSAHQYRLLVQGAVDFSLAGSLNPWDHAAAVLLCQQAGGHVAFLDGTPYDVTIDRGYLLCTGSKDTWDVLAAHFSDLN